MSGLSIDVLTIFPDLVSQALPYGILRRVQDAGKLLAGHQGIYRLQRVGFSFTQRSLPLHRRYRYLSAHATVKRSSQAVNIRPRTDISSCLRLLQRRVALATQPPAGGSTRIEPLTGCAKVEEYGLSILGDIDIGWFQVLVDKSLAMDVLQRIQQRPGECPGLFGGEGAATFEKLVQGFTPVIGH